jgi:hypothetical protein
MLRGALPDTPQGRALQRVRLDPGGEAEVAYALDPHALRARRVVTEYARDYRDAPDGWIPGTVDIVTPTMTVEAKFGAVPVDPPRGNPQQWFAAVARWCSGEGVRALHLVQAFASGALRHRVYTPTTGDLVQWAKWIATVQERVMRDRAAVVGGGAPRLIYGTHCGYCPARHICPAVSEHETRDNPADRYLVTGYVLARARAHHAAAKAALGDSERVADDGRRIVPRTRYRRELVSLEAALAAFPGLGRVTTRVLTMAAIDEWAERWGAGDTLADKRSAVNDALEEAGAITWTATTVYEEQSGKDEQSCSSDDA